MNMEDLRDLQVKLVFEDMHEEIWTVQKALSKGLYLFDSKSVYNELMYTQMKKLKIEKFEDPYMLLFYGVRTPRTQRDVERMLKASHKIS